MVKATAPGKLILLGEYAVLEGAPALVAAVNRRAIVDITSNNLPYHQFSSPTLDIHDICFMHENGTLTFYTPLETETKNKLEFIHKLLTYLFHNTSVPVDEIPPMDIIADTDAFYWNTNSKLGLGSSAALTVAFVAGFFRYSRNTDLKNPSKDDIFQHALKAHHAAQGSMGSGIDIAASVYGNILKYRNTPDETGRRDHDMIRHLPGQLHLIPIWTKVSASTPHLLRHLKQFKAIDPTGYRNAMDQLSLLSEDGIESFVEQDVQDFLEIIEIYYQALLDLGKAAGISIISDKHLELHNIVSEVGGVYKPSGAGLGDMGIAFTDDERTRELIIDALNNTDYEIIPLSVVRTGVEITKQPG